MALFPLMPATSPALDDDEDLAFDLLELARINRFRAHRDLAPLSEAEFLAEREQDRLRSVAIAHANTRYGKTR